MNISRLLLIGAALVATVTVGIKTLRPKTDPAAPAATSVPPQQDINQMIAGLEAKLKANPDDAESWRMLGLAFFEVQRFAESATAYKRAASLKKPAASRRCRPSAAVCAPASAAAAGGSSSSRGNKGASGAASLGKAVPAEAGAAAGLGVEGTAIS